MKINVSIILCYQNHRWKVACSLISREIYNIPLINLSLTTSRSVVASELKTSLVKTHKLHPVQSKLGKQMSLGVAIVTWLVMANCLAFTNNNNGVTDENRKPAHYQLGI